MTNWGAKSYVHLYLMSWGSSILNLRDEERPVRHEEVARMPPCTPHALWDERFETIRDQERYLARTGQSS